MPKKVTIQFDNAAFREILNNGATREFVQQQADAMAARAKNNSGRWPEAEYTASIYHGSYGGGRTIGSVWTGNVDAMLAQHVDKALSKAVEG